MDIRDLPAYLESLQTAAADAVRPAANKMAAGFEDRVKNQTLKQAFHAPRTFYRATPGRPPAYASGALSRSIFTRRAPAADTVYASAMVFASAKYAAIQEWGGWTEPRNHVYMHWKNPRPWFKRHVDLPEHPYFRPTTEEMIRDGSFQRLAISGFYGRIRPYFK